MCIITLLLTPLDLFCYGSPHGIRANPAVHDMTRSVFDSQQKPAFHVCLQVTPPPVWSRKCCLWAAMGQRAALLLSELLLLLLTASRTLLAVSFPEDVAPLDVVDAHCEYKWAKQTEGSKSQQHHHAPQKHTSHIYYIVTPRIRIKCLQSGCSCGVSRSHHIWTPRVSLQFGQLYR